MRSALSLAFAGVTLLVSGCGDDGTGPTGPLPEDGGTDLRPDGGPREVELSRIEACSRRGGGGDLGVEANDGVAGSDTTVVSRWAPPGPMDRFVATHVVYRLFDTDALGAFSCAGGVAHELRVFEGAANAGAPPATPENVRTIAVPADAAFDDPPDDCAVGEVCRNMVEREVALDPPIELAPGRALYAGVVVTDDAARACAALCRTGPPETWTATAREGVTTFNWAPRDPFALQAKVRGLLIEAPAD